MGLALWLIPEPTASTQLLETLQRRLAQTTDTASAPFPPHATLLSGLEGHSQEIWSQAGKIVTAWKNQPLQQNADHRDAGQEVIECRLLDAVTKGWYFQCVVLALDKTAPLLRLYDCARSTLDVQADGTTLRERPPYFPHISLLYSEISAEEAQQRIDQLKSAGSLVTLGHGVQVTNTGFGDDHIQPLESVRFTRLELWDCNGDVSSWKKLEGMDIA